MGNGQNLKAQDIPPLGKFIHLSEFQGMWAECFNAPLGPFWLPTEHVISSPMICVPNAARAFRTGFYILGEDVVSYNALVATYISRGEVFPGVSKFDVVILAEVWTDWGDDGHVEWRQEGYRFVSEKALAKRGCGWDCLPDCMTIAIDDNYYG